MFVQSEVEVAIEKGCRLIGVIINTYRFKDPFCLGFFADKGAMFVPFSSRIVAEALKGWSASPRQPGKPNDWYCYDQVYTNLGYNLVGNTAVLPPKLNPFLLGKPTWAKI